MYRRQGLPPVATSPGLLSMSARTEGRGHRATLFACALLMLGPTGLHAEPPLEAARAPGLLLEARAYEHGEGVERDLLRAAALYCEAARGGDAEAQFSLGWMYANGRGMARDDAMAALFFSLATQQGHAHARRMLRYVGEEVAQAPPCLETVESDPPEVVAQEAPPSPHGGSGPDEPADRQEDSEHDSEIVDFALATTPAQRKIAELVNALAPEYGVSPRLAYAVIRYESNFDPLARSQKNAQGLMQLIPETAARFNVTRPFDPVQNVRGGLAYLRWLLAYFRGRVPLVLAAYNAGEGTVNRHRGIPPFAETRAYVKRVMELFGRDEHPYDPAVTAPSPEFTRIRMAR